jgi:hypothetical protein
MTAKDAKRAELDVLLSEWREALLAASEAVRAEEGVLAQEDLAARARQLQVESKAVTAKLRRFARDEGLSPELVEQLLPG